MKKIKIVTLVLALMMLAACAEEEKDFTVDRVREEKTADDVTDEPAETEPGKGSRK